MGQLSTCCQQIFECMCVEERSIRGEAVEAPGGCDVVGISVWTFKSPKMTMGIGMERAEVSLASPSSVNER